MRAEQGAHLRSELLVVLEEGSGIAQLETMLTHLSFHVGDQPQPSAGLRVDATKSL
jgi:hypothetical protein